MNPKTHIDPDPLKISSAQTIPLSDYWLWRERHQGDSLFETLHRERVERLWTRHPLFEFITILEPGQEPLLADSIDSLAQQYYNGWRLSIFARTPSPEPEFLKSDSQVRWFQSSPEESIDTALNERLIESHADWFALFDCGTQFPPEMLLTFGDYIAIRPQWRLIYTDDDLVTKNQKFHSPRFKPDFNLEFLRSTDYIGSFCIEKSALMVAGGFSSLPGAERYDLLLRTLDAQGEAAIGHIPEVLFHLPDSINPGANDEGATQALRHHFTRRKIPADVLPGRVKGESRHTVYLHEETPKVSIIIPTRNRLDLLSPCIETLLKNTAYPNYELLIVDNDSDDPDIHAYYDRLCKLVPGRLQILHVPGPFDFSAMNNHAAHQAQGEYLLLLNNDTECIHAKWLDEMMSHAQRPDVGIVGARLLFPDSLKIQSAGSILGMLGSASHVFYQAPHNASGYMNRALVDQDYSAVTGACQLIRASVFHQVAGLEVQFKNQCQDIDLCLKVRELGYRVIWTPFATLLHHGSATLKSGMDLQRVTTFQQERNKFYAHWKLRLSCDPAWNRHLGLSTSTPTLEKNLVVSWNPDFHERPRVLVFSTSSEGSVEYRDIAPLRALNTRKELHYAAVCQRQGFRRMPTSVELDRLAPDVFLLHVSFSDLHCNALLTYKEYNPDIFRIYSLDDLMSDLPKDHPGYKRLPSDIVSERIRLGLKASNRLIVSTEPLFQTYRGMIDDIRLLPNTLEWRIWGALQSKRQRGNKLRVGWVGTEQHAGDLRFITEVVKATAKEVDWVFFGMRPEGVESCMTEFHAPCPFSAYPEKLASLDLDLAIAPLEIHPFNEAKSNLRLLEYGILGCPVICTDIFPYQTDNPPLTRLPNDPDKWIAAIRGRLGEHEALAREGDVLREWVKKHYLLENRLDQWRDAFTKRVAA
jgi:GT2 family glycosyltransferase